MRKDTKIVGDRIVVDPKVMVGKPIIKETRIPVDAIIKRIAEGMSIEELLEEYPNITKKDIKAALLYAAILVDECTGKKFAKLLETNGYDVLFCR